MSDALALALINFVQVVLLAYIAYRAEMMRQHVKNGGQVTSAEHQRRAIAGTNGQPDESSP